MCHVCCSFVYLYVNCIEFFFFFSSRRRHTRFSRDWSSDVCSSDLGDPDNPRKRNSFDFVLWRPSRDGEPEIPSRYGPGMPGWHIGCSAMARSLLGATVHLHGGGTDLIFPHHECEQAQTLALQTEPFVRTWHHCEFVRYRGEKMSKSLGNIVLARDLLAR